MSIMSYTDSDDICTDCAYPEEVPMTRFSGPCNKETLSVENPQTLLTQPSSYTTEKIVPLTGAVGKMTPTITISKEEYESLCAELKSKDQKLKALKNIHLLIQEKDEEVSSLKERNQTYADALMMSEVRHCQLLRIATRFAKDNAGSDIDKKQKTSSMNGSAKEISDPDLKKGIEFVSHQNSEMENPKGDVGHTLEEDSAILDNRTHASELSEDSVHEYASLETDAASVENKLPLGGFNQSNLEPDLKGTADHVLNRNVSDGNVQEITEQEDQAESANQLLLNPRGVPTPGYALPKKFPGVSQDLVNKLIRQNARLKQILRQVMSSQGIGVEDYLERQEYASVVEQLRQELKLSKNRVKDLEELLASVESQDTDGLRARNLQLQEMLQRQNKMLAVKQAMIDAFSRRCDEMEQQKQVKLQSLLEDGSIFSRNTQEIAASEKMATKTFATNTLWQKSHSAPSSSKGLDVSGATDEKQEQVAENNDALSDAPLIASSAVVSDLGISCMLVCKRCDREFDESDDEKYREHCTKCTDD